MTSDQRFVHPTMVFRVPFENRNLIRQMSKRAIAGRYRGSIIGLAWALLYPILMLCVYTFVFSVIFGARWPNLGQSKFEFAMVLFAGMIVHALFAECLVSSPGLVVGNTQYVKKVVFPLEILPWVTICNALFQALMSTIVLVVFFMCVHLRINWTVIFAPLVVLPLVVFTAGVSWYLAAVGVFIRDVGQIAGILATVLLFMSPIFYPVEALPEMLRPYIYCNPLTFIIEQFREIVIWGKPPNWIGLIAYMCIGTTFAWTGLLWFQRTRKLFADVL